jgi:AraC-like DNA-binding protein
MELKLYDIIPSLQPYIKIICSMENGNSGCKTSSFRVLPDTCVELFINYAGSRQTVIAGSVLKQPNCFIVSRMSRYMDVRDHGKSDFVSVCFFPGAAAHFFPVAMHEVSDTMIDLGDLWKSIAAEMEDRVHCATNNHQRVAIIQEYLTRQLEKLRKDDNAVEHWLWQVNFFKGQLHVEDLSRKANISQRQLGRRFNQTVGLSPKEFSRVTRFIHSLKYLKKYPSLSLTEIAYESGYYDQAHFIHDYKNYAGVTPGELIADASILY